MSQAVGSVFALAAFVGFCALLFETTAGISLSKDLHKAEHKLDLSIGEGKYVIASANSSLLHIGDDLVHLRMNVTTIGILTLVAAYVAFRLLWGNKHRSKHE